MILDIWIGKQTLKDRHRVKRVAPIVARVAWAAGRALFRSLAKSEKWWQAYQTVLQERGIRDSKKGFP